MKTLFEPIEQLDCRYPLETLYDVNKMIFLDIETTGFTAHSSSLYLIGCVVYDHDHFNSVQWFAESKEDEKNVLSAFAEFLKNYEFLIHYNGNHFDIPYLAQKMKQYEIDCPLESMQGLDLYRRIAPYRNFLKLPNCKQKTIETYLGILRDDLMDGGELIGVYLTYLERPEKEMLDLLLLHNAEDIRGMVEILPILAYVDLFHKPVTVTKVQANHYTDYQGNEQHEIVMKLKLPTPLPIQVSNYANHCFFSGLEQTATLKVPLITCELKYFYSNYKEYYYLPQEDVALHRSVASFVDKDHRKTVTAATCYTRKISTYLPEWDYVIEPFFKTEYASKELFFELTDEIKQDRVLFSRYAEHILQMLLKNIS